MGANISNQFEHHRLRHTLPIISLADLQLMTETYPTHVYFFLDDLVIDATQFIHAHPGGEKALRKRHMCDITEDYEWHSEKGKRMILSYARWRGECLPPGPPAPRQNNHTKGIPLVGGGSASPQDPPAPRQNNHTKGIPIAGGRGGQHAPT